MGVEAIIEIENGERVGHGSKAVAGLLSTLLTYCDLKNRKDVSLSQDREILQWFSVIADRMNQDVCLLSTILYWGEMKYTVDEYERYQSEWGKSSMSLMTKAEFVTFCRELDAKWTDLQLLHRTVNDFIRTLEIINPPDTFWYEREVSLGSLYDLSRTLIVALAQGHTRARFAFF